MCCIGSQIEILNERLEALERDNYDDNDEMLDESELYDEQEDVGNWIVN